ncbi:CGNR zinc finger domain-containing protein [Paenibacillus sp. KQZ6P-2]|uniref:CGNR zinc finger domain-containing protein n=1 Tax=Paenibacillus mangrovi TaxID=2931978 RepID=A0A9X1WQC8_9BACL|nr:CGNR zinc finger domain-containing protein [Paenibacillus mangrovi]MCJ8013118.1 CGNR zinc finger domain-containing protein [Paenibacillus mangrovi]
MLWDDFVNSEWHDWRGSGRCEDRLDQEKWLQWFMQQDQITATRLPSKKELNELKELRSFLFDLIRHITSGGNLAANHIETLNRWMGKAPVYRQLTQAAAEQSVNLSYFPANANWTQVMAEISASFASTLGNGELSRIRICDNPDCLWVYYDDTRNRSKRYCDDKMCGNLMKVRRFRAKKKLSTPPSTDSMPAVEE